jgi:hypothetical protein
MNERVNEINERISEMLGDPEEFDYEEYTELCEELYVLSLED